MTIEYKVEKMQASMLTVHCAPLFCVLYINIPNWHRCMTGTGVALARRVQQQQDYPATCSIAHQQRTS